MINPSETKLRQIQNIGPLEPKKEFLIHIKGTQVNKNEKYLYDSLSERKMKENSLKQAHNPQILACVLENTILESKLSCKTIEFPQEKTTLNDSGKVKENKKIKNNFLSFLKRKNQNNPVQNAQIRESVPQVRTRISHRAPPQDIKTRKNNEEEEEEKSSSANVCVIGKLPNEYTGAFKTFFSYFFSRKFFFFGDELNRRLIKTSQYCIQNITRENLVDFCNNHPSDTPDYISVFIPKEKEENSISDILKYTAYYPWQVDREKIVKKWATLSFVHEQLAYATFYGHPTSANELLRLYFILSVSSGNSGFDYKNKLVKKLEGRMKNPDDYMKYIVSFTLNSPPETNYLPDLNLLSMTKEDLYKYFENLVYIAKHGCKKKASL